MSPDVNKSKGVPEMVELDQGQCESMGLFFHVTEIIFAGKCNYFSFGLQLCVNDVNLYDCPHPVMIPMHVPDTLLGFISI